ncbi:TolC family protein [Polaribacter undariae]|uniref:TolC family protein n=1 Tax=Polaribacter sejongensis TaxID=985043 RepID=A0AAJ1QV77_9FLAO|nr:TolC family protein [Polaribacter undariae]MDN3618904.1 TolC family protein [Polaribacter undariae]UWD32994.1 TolC family protein [Polaribacter undariae]
MKLNRIGVFFSVVLGFITTFTNAQDITLKQAYDLMLSKNGDAKASSFEVKAMEEEHKATKGLRLPTIGVSGTYMHLDKDISADLNEQRNMVGGLLGITDPASVLGSWDFTLQEKNMGFATADISMPIYAGGKINAANKASEIKLALSETKHKIKEDALTIQLINYFFKLKLAQEAVQLRQEVYDVILLHNNQATKFFENGIIPEVETLNAKVALSNANRELLGAKKDVDLATTAVQNLIGVNSISGFSSEFKEPTIVKPLQEFTNDMLTENEQLKIIEKNHELAKVGVQVEKSDYFPKVGVSGKYILWKDNLPLVDTKWFVGVGVEWELFNGFQREHKIKASKYKISQVEEIDRQARLNLTTYTEKLYNTMQKELEQYESLHTDEALAKRLKFMRTRAFEEGTGTSLEVMDATLKLSEIKLHKIKALYEYNVAYGELMVLTGKTASFLNQN